jgi:hypothetical protein
LSACQIDFRYSGFDTSVQKLHCYVDETGQDTKGSVFFVSVVILEQERERLEYILERIEQASGKHKRKWSKSKPERRYAYMRSVLGEADFVGSLYYRHALNTMDYVQVTVQTTAEAIIQYATVPYKATVIVDGLSKTDERKFAAGLRQNGVRTEKIRGATDEADIFIRLADAVCGFLREALEHHIEELQSLMAEGIKSGHIIGA